MSTEGIQANTRTIQELSYREHPGINSSLLIALERSPQAAKELLDGAKKESYELQLGTLVDSIVLGDTSNKQYQIIKSEAPSEKMGEFAKEYIKLKTEKADLYAEVPEESIIMAARDLSGYNLNLKKDTVIEKFNKEAKNYCIEYIDAVNNKCIPITESMKMLAVKMADALWQNPRCSKVLTSSPTNIIIAKRPLYTNMAGVECKAEVDVITINTTDRFVRTYDVKTCTNIEDFRKNVIKYKYYLQAAHYHSVVKTILSNIVEAPKYFPEINKGDIKKYLLADEFYFLVVDQSLRTGVFALTSSELTRAKKGLLAGGSTPSGVVTKGTEYLTQAIHWHINSGIWDYTKDEYFTGFNALRVLY